MAIFITIIIALLMHGLFPDVTARPMRAVPHKDKESIRHEVLLCATVAFIGGENGHGNLMISSAIFHKPYER